MTPFGVIVYWTRGAQEISESFDVLGPIAQRCTDGSRSVSVPGAFASVGLRALKKGESLPDSVVVDDKRQRLILGDVRLYDRSAEMSRLRARGDESDLELVAKTIDELGPSGLRSMAGDFAIVIWDWGTQTLFAARDHFGLKSLHYRRLPNGFACASDVRQLLALDNDREVDAHMALDFLLSDYRRFGRTFFRSVRQVRPAHSIVVTEATSVESLYWSPPTNVVRYSHYEEVVEQWRHLFTEAVRCRLNSDYPIVSHLSGGLDSGSIVGAAHSIYASSSNRPELITLSAQFPGLDCDETAYIDSVVERTPLFRSECWNGLQPNTADFENPTLVIPGLRRGPGGGPRRDMEVAQTNGARTFLTGTGGDELGWARGVSRDLFKSLRIIDIASELFAVGHHRALGYVKEGMKGLIPARAENLHSPFRLSAPAWLGPRLKEVFPGERGETTGGGLIFTSHYQQEVWKALTSPLAATCIDMLTLVGAEAGLETKMPYLDLRLVEFVLSLPWMVRLPQGDMRRLQRDGVAAFLPNVVRRRMTKPNFASAISAHARSAFPSIERVLSRNSAEWASAEFLDQPAASSALAQLVRSDPQFTDWRGWRTIWLLAAFEIWLSEVSAYTPAERSSHGHG